ncbi:MAG: hypothetical protein JXB04_12465 [Kiritimatiellae bacterium]|nr:hypothetical protein [Kiritimatiellia bacterium]
MTVNVSYLLLWLLPTVAYANWIHAIDLGFASVLLMMFLRLRQRSWPACLLGAVAAFWLGSNFTLTYAGHIAKFGVLLSAAGTLYLVEKTVATRRAAWAVLAGGAMGLMFLEQPDVALFFALFLGLYFLYALWRDHTAHFAALVARLVLPMLVVALLVAAPGLLGNYLTGIKGVASLKSEDPRAKWEFATQWSWPPEESIDFIAPGFMGWRSGEQEAPYWGRMGRSAGWETTGQGFRNFKLENQYIGIFPIALAMAALVLSARRRRVSGSDMPPGMESEERPAWRHDVFFWSGAVAVTLLLSFGKYFPLYRVFYYLPIVNAIRNPNKFLQVFQVALGILAAYGLDGVIEWPRAPATRNGGQTWAKLRSAEQGGST